uniref:Poly(A) polymerase n=1 Tax=Mucochytrium quahogii TaxID=96639 RepID=A0A7S2WGQ5_9STRA|mmetsp:Transcript_1005/g.1622  ORF Transcript_1005/g.1622 Transcript_1005/m.1622 type:complete len:631 (-) Transcript_1005:1091-2983(-)
MERFIPNYTELDAQRGDEHDLHLTELLKSYLADVAPLETKSEREVRIALLQDMIEMLNAWVLRKLEEKHIVFEGEENELAGRVFVSGSYRLGVNTRGSDIDTICVVPVSLSREEFFDEEDGFIADLRKKSGVTYVNPVQSRVPIIEVVWNDIELDVLCAVMATNHVPQSPMDLMEDTCLIDVDEVSRTCLNGPRVTELMIKLVPNTETFKLCLRAIRLWSKVRGTYSNKMGFLGGVNWALLVAFACQLFPQATPSRLLAKFFNLYSVWKWPTEIRLCREYEVEGMDAEQWAPRSGQLMPIITPAYPCMNSSYNVTRYNLQIMSQEFARGKRFVMSLQKRNRAEKITDFKAWGPLFAKSDFFTRYKTYIVIKATCTDEDVLSKWGGWVEARIRRLVEELDRFSFKEIYPFPAKFSHEDVKIPFEGKRKPRGKTEDDEEKKLYASYWYVGFEPHPINSTRAGKAIDLSHAAVAWSSQVKAWDQRTDEMDICLMVTQWKYLPDDPKIFPEGKKTAFLAHKKRMRIVRAEHDQIKRQSVVYTEHDDDKTKTKTDAEAAPEDEVKDQDSAPKAEKEDEEDEEQDENLEKMQTLLGKRTRDAQEEREVMQKVGRIKNFFELPQVGGLNPNAPLRLF